LQISIDESRPNTLRGCGNPDDYSVRIKYRWIVLSTAYGDVQCLEFFLWNVAHQKISKSLEADFGQAVFTSIMMHWARCQSL
jgi:hypothetical protein